MSRAPHIVVSRIYRAAPDACARALTLLLKKPVIKEVAEPAPEPDSHHALKTSANEKRRLA